MKKISTKSISKKTAKIIAVCAAAVLLVSAALAIVLTNPHITKLNKYAVQAVAATDEYAKNSPNFSVSEIRYLKNSFSTSKSPYVYYVKYTIADNPTKDDYIIAEVRSVDNVSGSTRDLKSKDKMKAGKAKFINISWKSAQDNKLKAEKVMKKYEKQKNKALLKEAEE